MTLKKIIECMAWSEIFTSSIVLMPLFIFAMASFGTIASGANRYAAFILAIFCLIGYICMVVYIGRMFLSSKEQPEQEDKPCQN